MRRAGTRAAALLAALAAGACATVPRGVTPPEGPYGAALAAATRQAAIYDGLAAQLFVYATRETPAYRAARTRELARLYQVPEAEADGRAPAVTAPVEGHVFVVVLHSDAKGPGDLRAEAAPWALTLAGPKGRASAASIQRVEGFRSAVQALYPHIDPFFSVYRVAFPAEVGEGPLKLTVAGPGGRATLDFQ